MAEPRSYGVGRVGMMISIMSELYSPATFDYVREQILESGPPKCDQNARPKLVSHPRVHDRDS